MASDPRKKSSATPSWKGGGNANSNSKPAYSWKADSAPPPPGTAARRTKQFLYGFGSLLFLVGIGILIWLLWLPPRPGFIAIGADPKPDATKQYVPIDLYGWQSGLKILESFGSLDGGLNASIWGRQVPQPHTKAPLSLPERPEDLQAWADDFARYSTIIIYFGLHTGADQLGPFVYIGNDKAIAKDSDKLLSARRHKIVDLLKPFKSPKLAEKQKIFIFDPGRLPPNPLYGHLQDQFAQKLQGISEEILAVPNLMVICGSAPQQQGWESEELGSTALANAVLETLRGKNVGRSPGDRMTGQLFFDSIQTKVREWSTQNRSRVQEPFILPSGEKGQERAKNCGVCTVQDLDQVQARANAAAMQAGESLSVPQTSLFERESSKLEDFWKTHDELTNRQPNPASYAPRLWRSYRLLLIRYEQALRAGESGSAGELNNELAIVRDKIYAACEPTAPLTHKIGSLALWSALQRRSPSSLPSNDEATKGGLLPGDTNQQALLGYSLLGRLAKNFTIEQKQPAAYGLLLEQSAKLLTQYRPERRPVELHLPVMVNHFYQELTPNPTKLNPTATNQPQPNPVPVLWGKLFALRQLAEQACYGITSSPIKPRRITPRSGEPDSFAERVWPLVQANVIQADLLRRQAEDEMFYSGSDPAKETPIVESIEKARKLYQDCVVLAENARIVHEIHDTLYADLPFLAHWLAEQPENVITSEDVRTNLWGELHKLSDKLDQASQPAQPTSPPNDKVLLVTWQTLRQDAEKLAELYEQYFKKFVKDYTEGTTNQRSQQNWDRAQILLRVPLIPQKQRMELLGSSRTASKSLAEGKTAAGAITAGSDPTIDRKSALKNLLNYTLSSFNPIVQDSDSLQTTQKIQFVKDKCEAYTKHTDEASAEEQLNLLAEAISLQYQRLSQFSFAMPEPTASTTDLRGERCSRLAIPYEPDLNWSRDQSANNARRRWLALLQGQEMRIATDHWYDETYTPEFGIETDLQGRYFRRSVDNLLADEKSLAASLTAMFTDPKFRPATNKEGLEVTKDRPELDARLGVKPLRSANRSSTVEAILWNTEPQQLVKFSVFGTAASPIKGNGVALLIPNAKSAFQGAITQNQIDGKAPLLIGGPAEISVPADFKLVVQNDRATDAKVEMLFYFRGQTPRTVQPFTLQNKPFLIISNELPDKNAPTYVAIRADPSLPRGPITLLLDCSGSMRQYLDGSVPLNDITKWRDAPDQDRIKYNVALQTIKEVLTELPDGTQVTIRVFSHSKKPSGSERIFKGAVNWRNERQNLDSLMNKLRALEPNGFTPLVESIRESVLQDFEEDDRKGSCLVLLTDGVEETEAGKVTGDNLSAKVRDLTQLFSATGRGADIALQVVSLGLSKSDLELSSILFDQLDNHNTPGGVWDASDAKELAAILRDAVSPKLRLRNNDNRSPGKYPRDGFPSTPATSTAANPAIKRDEIRYSMNIGADSFATPSIGFNTPTPNAARLAATVSSARQPSSQDILPSPGVSYLLYLRAGQTEETRNRVEIVRDLTADVYADRAFKVARTGNWLMTIPAALRSLTNEFSTIVALEKIPVNHPKFNGPPEKKLSFVDVQHIYPKLMWWDVRPTSVDPMTMQPKLENLRPESTTRIVRTYGRYAPSWKVNVSHWPEDEKNNPRPARIRAFVTDELSPTNPVTLEVNSSIEQEVIVGDTTLKVRVSLEEKVFPDVVKSRDQGPIPKCLVVRCQHFPGNPVYATVELEEPMNAEHQYFGGSPLGVTTNDVVKAKPAYTAYFWPREATSLALGQVKVKLIWHTMRTPLFSESNPITMDLTPSNASGTQLLDDDIPKPSDTYKPQRRISTPGSKLDKK